MSERLAIHRVQHGVTSAVGSGACTLRSALAEMRGHAAEGPLIDFSILFAPREGQTPVLELINGGGRITTKIFDSILVTEPIGALDGVVHVPAPVILSHVAQRGCDSTLGGNRMRAGRK